MCNGPVTKAVCGSFLRRPYSSYRVCQVSEPDSASRPGTRFNLFIGLVVSNMHSQMSSMLGALRCIHDWCFTMTRHIRTYVVAVAMMLCCCMTLTGCSQDGASIDGRAIPQGQLAYYADQARLRTSPGDVRTMASVMRKAIADDQALFAWAAREGYGDYTSWDAIVRSMKRANVSNMATVGQRGTVYGVTTFSIDTFHSQLVAQAKRYLIDTLSQQAGQELYVSEGEARQYFDRHRDAWSGSQGYQVIRLTVDAQDADPREFRQAVWEDGMDDTGPSEHLLERYPSLSWNMESISKGEGGSPHAQAMASAIAQLKKGEVSEVESDGQQLTCMVNVSAKSDDDADFGEYSSRIITVMESDKLEQAIASRAENIKVDIGVNEVKELMKTR